MNNLFELLKVQTISTFKLNKLSQFGKAKKGGFTLALVFVTALMVGLIGGIGYFYSMTFAQSLALINRLDLLFPLMISFCALVGLVFSFYTFLGSLYSTKEYNFLSALPLKPSVIVISKIVFSFVLEFLFTLIIICSTILFYNFNVSAVSYKTVVKLIFVAFFTPCFTVVFSLLFDLSISFISSKARRKVFIQNLLTISFVIIVILFSFLAESGELSLVINKIFFLSVFVEKGLINWVYLLLYALILIASLVIVVTLISCSYSKLISALSNVKNQTKIKINKYKTKSVFSTLYAKETRLLFSSPTYFLNTIMGCIMAIVVSVLSVVLLNALGRGVIGILIPFTPAIFAFCYLLSPTTACSFSVEGNTFWITATSPISLKTVLFSKLSINVTYGLSSLLISVLVLGIGLGLNFFTFALLTLTGVLLVLSASALGLIFNLHFPVMKWKNINVPVKQSISVLLCCLISLATSVLFFANAYFLQISPLLKLCLTTVFSLILCAFLYVYLFKNVQKLINKKIL